MPKISAEEVRQIAALARLDLGADEVIRIASELDAILTYVDQIQTIDTTGVEPLTHAVAFDCPLRPDEVEPSLSIDDVLANAPRREDRFFEVPRIVPVADSAARRDGHGNKGDSE